MIINLDAIQGPPVAFHKLTRAQLLTLAIALQDQRDNALAYARDLEARVGRVEAIADISMNSEHGDPAFISGWQAALEEVQTRLTATEGQA